MDKIEYYRKTIRGIIQSYAQYKPARGDVQIYEKIWIQHDGTEDGVANDLVKAGVPRDQIVLAFKSPDLRQHTDFAVASVIKR